MTKKLKIILAIISVLITSLTLLILYYPVLINQSVVYVNIKRDYNNSVEVTSNGKPLASYQSGYTFEKYYTEIYKKYEFIFTKIDPFSPVVTLVAEEKDGSSSYNALSLKRIGLSDFSYESQIGGSIKNKTFQEAVEIARKYDLTKENPDPANIVVYPAPTREEVAKSKTRDTKDEELRNNPAFQPDLDKCISYIAKTVEEQKVQVQCLKDINTKYNTTYDIPKI